MSSSNSPYTALKVKKETARKVHIAAAILGQQIQVFADEAINAHIDRLRIKVPEHPAANHSELKRKAS